MSGRDERAFEALFAELVPDIRAFAGRHAPAGAAEDVVSETFLTVWRRWDALPDEPDGRRAWVFTIARFQVAHARRDAGRSHRRVVRLAQTSVPADTLRPFRHVEETDAALRALDVLPTAEREALELLVIDGLTPAEAAGRLGCSLTALSSRVARARRRLEAAGAPADDGAREVTSDER